MPITSDLPKLSALETAQRIHLTIMPEMFSNMPRDNISAWLCQEASKVYGYLSQISTYRNSLLPIHRLPPELLISIFSYALPSTPLRQSFDRLEILATICKKWRDLTHHPKFWSTIDLSWFPHSRTKRCLDMSRGAPLDITINDPEIGYQPKVELFTTASIMPRLHSLILNTRCASTVQKWVQDISAMEFPSFLHTLELNVTPRRGTSQNMPVLNLPANLQPRRALRLQAVKVPFDNPGWNNLTRIEILDMNCFQDYEPYTMHEFFDVLERCRDLETISVRKSRLCTQYVYSPQVLHLHKLRHLEFENSVDSISELMHRIAIPATSTIILLPTEVNRPTEFDFRQLLPSDISSIPILRSVGTISLTRPNCSSYTVNGTSKPLSNAGGSFRLVVPCPDLQDITPPDNSSSLMRMLGEHTKNHLIRTIPNVFNHSILTVRELRLTGVFRALSTEDWTGLLGYFPYVQCISWRNSSSSRRNTLHTEIPFLDAISRPLDQFSSSGISQCDTKIPDSVIPCPKLRILSLRFVDIIRPSFEDVVLEKLRERILICKGSKLERLSVTQRYPGRNETKTDLALSFQEVTEEYSMTRD